MSHSTNTLKSLLAGKGGAYRGERCARRGWFPVAGVAVVAKMGFMAFASIDPLDISILTRRRIALLKLQP
jgi:hypothetical protein